jgi:tetratricopeptide (TPR) repeat protein
MRMAEISLDELQQSDDQRTVIAYDLVSGSDALVAADDRRLAEAGYRKALAIYQELAAADPDNAEWQHDLTVCHLRIGRLLTAAGDHQGALAAYNESLAIIDKVAAADRDNPRWQRNLASFHEQIGSLLAKDDREGALDSYNKSIAILEKLVGADPDNGDLQRDLAVCRGQIGNVLAAESEHVAALALGIFKKGLAAFEKIATVNPDHTRSQDDLAVCHARIGDMLKAGGDWQGSLAAYNKSLAIFDRLVAADPGNALRQQNLAIGLWGIGDLQAAKGDRAAASVIFNKSLAIFERLVAADSTNAKWQRDLKTAQAKVDALWAEGGVSYTDDTPPPEAAPQPRLRMADASAKIDELAALLPDEQREAFKGKVEAAFAAATVITAPKNNEPRGDFNSKLAAAETEATERRQTRLYLAIHRHRLERERLPLPEEGYTNEQDALAAARLANNFRNLQKRLKAAGMEPLPPDDRVLAAQRLSKDYFRGAELA